MTDFLMLANIASWDKPHLVMIYSNFKYGFAKMMFKMFAFMFMRDIDFRFSFLAMSVSGLGVRGILTS